MKQGKVKMGVFSSSNITANSDGNTVTITIPKISLSSNFSNADGDVPVAVTETKTEGIGAYKNMIFIGLIGVAIGYIVTRTVK